MIIIGICILIMVIGMIIVRVRSDRSRISALIPGINYYTRTQIAWWSTGLSITTSWLNIVLLAVIVVAWYGLVGRDDDYSIRYNSISYLQSLPKLLSQNTLPIIIRLILQLWVNWWVAHHRGRWLLTWLELTFLWPIFWLLLWLSSKSRQEEL